MRNKSPTMMFYQPIYEQKSSPMKLSSFHLFGRTFRSPPLKFFSCCQIGSRVLDSWYYDEKYQCKKVACYCYQKLRQTNFFKKNFGNFLISNWMLQSKEFNPENSNTWAITIKRHASRQELYGGNRGNLADQSPRGNMFKLFDCIKTPLRRFLACLTFHRKEILLCHLHKRTNPGSAPAKETPSQVFFYDFKNTL